MDIIDLGAERRKREQPDAEFVRRDDFGREMYAFALEYRMNDLFWGTTIWAYDFADAEARVAAMRESLKVGGQIYGIVPA